MRSVLCEEKCEKYAICVHDHLCSKLPTLISDFILMFLRLCNLKMRLLMYENDKLGIYSFKNRKMGFSTL